MATQNNLLDNVVETQKKVLDTVVENTKKFSGGNSIMNETIEKGTDWYKNWLEDQKNLFTKATNMATGATASHTEAGKENHENTNHNTEHTAKANDFFEQWMNVQKDWAKKIYDMGSESAKKFTDSFSANTAANQSNPYTAWMNNMPNMNWMNNMPNNTAWMNNMPNMNWMNNMPNMNWMNNMPNNTNWMANMQNMNPFNADSFKKVNENFSSMFNQYFQLLNTNFSEFSKNMQNGSIQDVYKNMTNSGEGFAKFAEVWTPMLKSIQDKSFNMDVYKQFMNPELYKDFMDKFFGFMPESSRQQMHQFGSMINDGMKKMNADGTHNFHQMRNMMNNAMNNGSGQMFGNMNSAYTNLYNSINESVAPFAKLITPTQQTKTIQEWAEINHRIMLYNMKNAELQYMMYNQGTKVMDKLAENIAEKVKEGKEITSMLALYQEWLNISDKVYVSLFESSNYSELMSEVGSMQMKLRKDIELQTEKMFKDIPVATRSEMDEVYKTIYDLKKQVRELEKKLNVEPKAESVITEETTEEKATKAKAKKA